MRKIGQIPVHPTVEDVVILEAIAKNERRRVTDVIRNIIEDVYDGNLVIEVEPKEERKTTSFRYDEELKRKIDALRVERGMSIDKVIHLALKKLAPQVKPELVNH